MVLRPERKRQIHDCDSFSSTSAAGTLDSVDAPRRRRLGSAYRSVTSVPSGFLSVDSCRRAPPKDPYASDSSLAVNTEGVRKVWISPEVEYRTIPNRHEEKLADRL